MTSSVAAGVRQKTRALRTFVQQKQGTPWDLAPRPDELGALDDYREATRVYRIMLREDRTMITARRGRRLHRVARDVDRRGVPGALVDCGVWNGGSTLLLHSGSPSREIWAFDSFEGLPDPGDEDGPESVGWTGECLGAEERLWEGFERYGDPERLHVRKGWFEDTLPAAVGEIGPIAVLHADGDWYESVLLTLRTLYPLVSPGGWIVIDDYGHWVGAKAATDEFRREVQDASPLVRVDYAGRCWRKAEAQVPAALTATGV